MHKIGRLFRTCREYIRGESCDDLVRNTLAKLPQNASKSYSVVNVAILVPRSPLIRNVISVH